MIKEIDGVFYHVSTLPLWAMNSWHKKLLGIPPYCSDCEDLSRKCDDCSNKNNRQQEHRDVN